jgi:hypothetical protein
LNQEDINHLKRCITVNEIKAVTKSLLTMKILGMNGFTVEFEKKEELIPMFFKLFHKTESERMLPNS